MIIETFTVLTDPITIRGETGYQLISSQGSFTGHLTADKFPPHAPVRSNAVDFLTRYGCQGLVVSPFCAGETYRHVTCCIGLDMTLVLRHPRGVFCQEITVAENASIRVYLGQPCPLSITTMDEQVALDSTPRPSARETRGQTIHGTARGFP